MFNAARDARGLSAPAKLLLFLLLAYEGKDGTSFASHQTLAEASGLSERAVRYAITELREKDLVEVWPGRQHVPTRYAVRADRLSATRVAPIATLDPAQGGTHCHPGDAQGGKKRRPGWQKTLPRVAPIADEGSIKGVIKGVEKTPAAPLTLVGEPAVEKSLILPSLEIESDRKLTPKAQKGIAKAKRPSPPGTNRVIAVFVEELQERRGPDAKPKIGAKEILAAGRIIDGTGGVEQAIATVRHAFASDRLVQEAPALGVIAKGVDANRYLGRVPELAKAREVPPPPPVEPAATREEIDRLVRAALKPPVKNVFAGGNDGH
jgi:hypothetical protein